MKSIITSFIIVMVLALPLSTFGQGDWSDDFNAGTIGTGWYGNAHYSLSQSDGMLVVDTKKTAMWTSFGVNIPEQNLTANPVINLSLKTAQPFMLSVYLFSGAGNILITQTVMPSAQFNTLAFDFTGLDISNKVLNAVNAIGFAVNGAGLSWNGTIFLDNLVAGSSAIKYANLGAVPDVTFSPGTAGHKLFIRGIKNTASLQLTGADALLENVSISPVSATGTSWINFDCKAGVDASALVSLTAIANPGFVNNSVQFNLNVEGNRPPTLDNIPNVQASMGKLKNIELTGITDGNSSVDQTVMVTAVSNNTAVIDNPVLVTYKAGSRYAGLSFTPKAAGTATITVTADDQSAADNTVAKSFDIEVLEGWNSAPTLDFIPNAEVLNTAGEQTMILKGISDGDNGSQTLTFTATSSDAAIIPDPAISYTSGKTAELKYTPVAGTTGFVTVTLTISDNGGAAGNNGDQSLVRTFTIEAYNPPLSGYTIPFTGAAPDALDSAQAGKLDYWHIEGLGKLQNVSFIKDGADDVFKIDCVGKDTWTGAWYYTPDMDLTDSPLMSMWVKCDKAIRVHIYFWDDNIRNNEDHHLEFPVVADTWTKLNFDFSDPKGMLNSKGLRVNSKRIKKVLFNYHPDYNWPFTGWTGTVQFKDIRIGDQADFTPANYYCTVDPVGQHSYYGGSKAETINLTGISRGKDKLAQVNVSAGAKITGVTVTPATNGEATVSFTPSGIGLDTIKVTVTGAEINGKIPVTMVMNIPIVLIDKTIATATALTTNRAETHQVYRGLGAKNPSPNLLDRYTLDFGASAIRFGILDDNQVEPENDNEDPNVLDMTKLNYDAFDWTYIKNLKARGVETFLLTFWSPPAWMKENLSTNYQQPAALTWETTTNKVLTDMYDEYAEDAVAVVKMFKQEADVDLAGIGLQNEPAFCEPYASAILSPDKFADMIVRVGKRFEAEGITTKLYAAEQVGGFMSDGPVYNHASYLAAFDKNAEVKKYSDVFAVHGYASDGIQPGVPPGSAGWAADFAAINANGKTRELWMTETEPAFTNWTDAFTNAANILTAFESGDVSLWAEWAWDSHCISQGKPTQKLWAQSMFSFIRPGAKRITSASGNNDILMSSWVNDAAHGGKTVIVLMNKGLLPISVTVNQEDMAQKYTVNRCSENVARFQDDTYLKGDKLLMGPKSIVTLVSGVVGEPNIEPVSDQSIFIDAATRNLTLSGINDGYDVNQYPVSVNYSLTDNTIISGPALSYSSPANSGTFSFSPAKAGATEVTLTVTANGVVTEEKFIITVKDYMSPTISPVSGSLRYADNAGTTNIDLGGISDGDGGGQTLSVSAQVTSTAPAGVVENLAVNYNSPSSAGVLSFTPGVAGNAEITITVVDNGPEGKNTTSIVFNVEVFSTVGISNSILEKVKLYPSPATDKVFVEFPENSFTKYSVYTADGMLTGSKTITGNKIEVNTSALSKGFYLLILEGKEKPAILNFVK
jgi:O-glycosyl hydrolase